MVSSAAQRDLPVSIERVAERLRGAYDGRVAPAAVDALVRDCYAPLARARIGNFVPNLVEHTCREQLRALTDGTQVRPSQSRDGDQS